MSSTGKNKQRPKKEVLGELLLNKIFERDFHKGSQFLYIAGSPGSGKTSLGLGIVSKIIRTYPDELVFWRESLDAPVQFTKYPGDYQILCERRFPIVIREISANRRVVKDFQIRRFEGFKQLVSRARGGCLNVVYFRDPFRWTDFIRYLIKFPGFQTVVIDELEDITPEFSGGAVWRKNKEFAEAIKQIRKGCVTIIANSQNISDCDHRIRKKSTMRAYLHGSVVSDASPVHQRAIQSLPVGSCWLDYGAEYGQIRFRPFEPIPQSYVVEVADDGV